jgi:DNA-binding response OmpR family regulator
MATTILIAERSDRLVQLMKEALTLDGFRVLTAGSGETAHTLARQARPDLIIFELALPDAPGCDFVRRHSQVDGAPIIVLAAHGAAEAGVRCLDLGADDVLVKPFSIREMTLRVRAVLRRSGHHHAGPGPTAIHESLPAAAIAAQPA